MHSNGATLSITIDERIFGPTPLVRTHAAPSKHLLHAVVQAIRKKETSSPGAMLAGENGALDSDCLGNTTSWLAYSETGSLFLLSREDRSLKKKV